MSHFIDEKHGPATKSDTDVDGLTIFWIGWAKSQLASAHSAEQAGGRCSGTTLATRCWACCERAALVERGIL